MQIKAFCSIYVGAWTDGHLGVHFLRSGYLLRLRGRGPVRQHRQQLVQRQSTDAPQCRSTIEKYFYEVQPRSVQSRSGHG
jgi:hypothetical protein